MQNQKALEQLGYSRSEAKVYLAALALGEAHISDIAEKVKMPRSSVQVIVERLHEGGLMNFYVMRRYKYWVAEDPAQLLKQLKQREEMVEEVIPSLVALKTKARLRHRDTRLKDLGPLQSFADGVHQPVLITSSEGEIYYVNKAWEEEFGYSHEEVVGQNANILKSGQTAPEEYDRLWTSLKTGKLFVSEAIVNQRKNGTLFSFLTVIFAAIYANRIFYVQLLEPNTDVSGA